MKGGNSADFEHKVVALWVRGVAKKIEAHDPRGDGKSERENIGKEPPKKRRFALGREVWIRAGHGLFTIGAIQSGIILRLFPLLRRLK